MKEMTVGVLKKPQVNDNEESSVSGGGKQWIPQRPRAPRNSTRCVQESYRCDGGPFSVHPFWPIFRCFLPSSSPCGATLKPRRSQTSQSEYPSNSKNNVENFTEVEKKHSISRSGPVERSHLFGLVNYMIFGMMREYPIHVYEPL